jgi:hypothetical protein
MAATLTICRNGRGPIAVTFRRFRQGCPVRWSVTTRLEPVFIELNIDHITRSAMNEAKREKKPYA